MFFDLLPFVTICYDFRTLLKAQTDGRIALAAHRVANGNDEKIADHGIETYCSKPVRRSVLSVEKSICQSRRGLAIRFPLPRSWILPAG